MAVVLVPDVLAKLHPEPDDAAPGRDLPGNHPVRDTGVGLAGNLAQRVEMPVVVEEPVVRMQRLGVHPVRKARRQPGAFEESSIVAHPRGVELAHPPVLADAFAIDRDVAEHHRDAAARVADGGAPALVVFDQRIDLPGIAQDVARNAHLRERDDRRPRLARPLDEPEHRLDVEVRPSGAHLHLYERDGR